MRHASPRARLALIPVLLVAGACEVSSEGPRDRDDAEGTTAMMPATEADSIASAVRRHVTTILASGAQAATTMPAVYTADAVLSDESEATHAGQAAIARAFAQGIPPGATIDIRSTSVIGSGDLVVDMGTYTFTMPNPQGGAAMPMNGRYLVVLQRMTDGSWKIARQLTDVVGIGGAMPGGPPPAAGDSAAGAPQPVETGFSN